MPKAWYQRLWIVLAAVLGSIYLLIPTFFWDPDESIAGAVPVASATPSSATLVAPNSTSGSMTSAPPPTPAAVAVKAEKSMPGWMSFFPKRRLRLGLDLVGGSHLALAVDTEETLRALANGHRKEIKSRLEKEGIPFVAVNQPLGTAELQIVLENASDREALRDIMEKFVDQRMEEVRFGEENGKPAASYGFSSAWKADISDGATEQVLTLLRDRVNSFGVAEPNIFREQANRIVVELPGLKDPAEAIENIKRTALLEFHIVDEEWYRKPGQTNEMLQALVDQVLAQQPDADDSQINLALRGRIPEDDAVFFKRGPMNLQTKTAPRTEIFLLKREVALTGDRLTDANPVQDRFGAWEVSFRLDQEGADRFAQLTDDNKGKRLAVVLEGVVKTDPVIKDRIDGGEGVIQLGSGRDRNAQLREASDISRVLKTGALPAPVRIVANRTVGPSLGQDAIRKGVNASVVGMLLVFAFAVAWYRKSGVIAIAGLLANAIVLLGVMTLFDATLTLPGMAGIVLTIGMAVDANVLIYERIREELRAGKPIRSAVDAGFEKAFSSIVDGNLTTAAAGLVLYWMGTDQIKGFAVTLLVGISTTLFTALVISRLLFDLWVLKYKPQELSI